MVNYECFDLLFNVILPEGNTMANKWMMGGSMYYCLNFRDLNSLGSCLTSRQAVCVLLECHSELYVCVYGIFNVCTEGQRLYLQVGGVLFCFTTVKCEH